MATRNRSILFRKYRDSLKSVRAPTRSAQNGGIELVGSSFLNHNSKYAPLSTEDRGSSSGGAVAVGLPPAWVDVSEAVTSNVQHAKVKMAELSKAHAKALMPSFGEGKEDQHRIEALAHEITDLLKKSEKRLSRLSADGPSEDLNIRKNVQRSLATDLQILSSELHKKQSAYLKRPQLLKEVQDGDCLEMKFGGNKSKLEDDDDLDEFVLSERQTANLKSNDSLTLERDREIQQVVASVTELVQIMKDLSVLVIEQGTIIDRIDYNVQNVAARVEEGFKQLQKVERNQKQGGLVKCAMILVIMCFVMLVLLVFKEIILQTV